MQRIPSFLAAAGAALGLAAAARADVVFDNGQPSNDGASEASRWVQAEDFGFNGDTTVTGASVYIGSADLLPLTQPFDGAFEYWLFANAAGAPGAVLANGFADATVTETGQPWSQFATHNAYRFDVDFDAPFAAAGGETYWFGFHLNSDYTRDQLYWVWPEVCGPFDCTFGNGHQSQFGTLDNWETNEWEHAFQLHGVAAVPEPGAWALMIAGFGAAGTALRTRRRRALT